MGLVGTLGVIETEVITDTCPGISSILVCFQIHLFVLHCPPQPLDEQIVAVPPFPIHADPDSVLLQKPGEALAGERGDLVGVEDLRLTLPKSILQSLDTEVGIQGV